MDLIVKAFLLTLFFLSLYLSFRYLIFSFRILRGWDKGSPHATLSRSDLPEVSVVVCFRNEEKHLERLIQCLSDQEYPRHLMEILLLDDHSTDHSPAIARKASETDYRIHYIPLPDEKKGKHAALEEALRHVSSKYIATTDADCLVPSGWLMSMMECITHNRETLVLGSVKVQAGKSFLTRFQALEACALQTVTASYADQQNPIMANGASMLFPRSLFSEYMQDEGRYVTAGDDTFLVHFTKKRKQTTIAFNKNPRGIVTTFPQKYLGDLINQRIRWLSKGKNYTDKPSRKTMRFIGIINLFLFFLFIGSFINPVLRGSFIIFFSLKALSDLLIIIPSARLFRQTALLWNYLPFSLAYPVYTLVLAIVVKRPYSWKGRTYR